MELYSRLEPETKISNDFTLHLIELNKDILNTLNENNGNNNNNNNNNKFLIKSEDDKSAPYFVTSDSSYLIRQKNHSNCMMLLDSNSEMVDSKERASIGVALFESQLELSKIEPRININGIPILNDLNQLKEEKETGSVKPLRQVFEDSNVSQDVFENLKNDLKLVEIDNSSYIISDDLIIEIIYLLISTVISNNSSSGEIMDYFNDIEIDELVKLMHEENPQYPCEIIEMILKKYNDKNKLKHDEIVGLFGIKLLMNTTKLINEDEFILNLKSTLPVYYNPDINIDKCLKGKFIRSLQDPLKIQYLNSELLSKDIGKRLGELFKIKSVWELSELEPFIMELNSKNVKLDKFLLKFARVKKQGKKILVTSR